VIPFGDGGYAVAEEESHKVRLASGSTVFVFVLFWAIMVGRSTVRGAEYAAKAAATVRVAAITTSISSRPS
jgi:hypothetical protein